MKKVFRKLFTVLAIGSAATFMVGCDDDETPAIDQQVLVDAQLASFQTQAEALITDDATATGLGTNNTVWDDWTLASSLGLLNKEASGPTLVIGTVPQDTLRGGALTADRTLDKDTIYVLDGRVVVPNGITLTIEAGTVIKGESTKSAFEAATLMIARGGKLIANGTASNPIIMTTTLDDIQPGQIKGSLDESDRGNWGGLVVLGKAPISAGSGSESGIEGVPSSDSNGLYGGTVSDDNSGSMKYISIRHGGITLDNDGNEINGLTLGGVGSGTVIENIEVIANNDDGIEFFGGTVNVNNILIVNQGDDGVDIDQSYSGTVDNFWVVMGYGESDEGLEIDGREGTAGGSFTLTNGLVQVKGTQSASPADFKSRAEGTVNNVEFDGFPTASDAIKIRFDGKVENGVATYSSDAIDNLIDGTLKFTKIDFSGNVRVYNRN